MLNIPSKTFNPEVLYVFDAFWEPGQAAQQHFHDSIELSVIVEGTTVYHIDNKTHILKQGDVICLNPYTMHWEEQPDASSSHQLHIGIENFQLSGYEPNCFPARFPILDLGSYRKEFMKTIQQIIKEKNNQNPYQDLAMKHLVSQLWVHIFRATANHGIHLLPKNSKKADKKKLINDIIYYLETYHAENIRLESISSKMYISPAYISKLFKEETGDTPINYLIKVRMNKAKELLENEEMSIKEVANLVGYQDAYHFSKLFKKYFNIPPSEYSKRQS
ncbi:AraC family transcriptional regulator [Vagococcus elongatus]|nr:AraC family transcriptional regulator [Vagococcus elongatus]